MLKEVNGFWASASAVHHSNPADVLTVKTSSELLIGKAKKEEYSALPLGEQLCS